MFIFVAHINDGGMFPTHQGAVEVFVNGRWSSVCDTGFDDNAASKDVFYNILQIQRSSYRWLKCRLHGKNVCALVQDKGLRRLSQKNNYEVFLIQYKAN